MAIASSEAFPSKRHLRSTLLTQRKALSQEEWQVKSQQLCERLIRLPLLQAAQTILVYRSFRCEPDLNTLWEKVGHSKKWGLPRCQGSNLTWHEWSIHENLPFVRNRFNIEEPGADWPKLSVTDIDLILVPTVACDRQGYRLGYGGGFYDHLLQQPEWRSIPTIGVVFDDFILDCLPSDPWDQPLDAIASEHRLLQIT